jgi:hypothetical protein
MMALVAVALPFAVFGLDASLVRVRVRVRVRLTLNPSPSPSPNPNPKPNPKPKPNPNQGTTKKSNATCRQAFVTGNANLNWLALARCFLFASRDFWFEVPLPFFLRSPSCLDEHASGDLVSLTRTKSEPWP